LLLAFGVGCGRRAKQDAAKEYQDAWLKLKRGDLSGASAAAEAGLQSFPSTASEWHWRFVLLKAEIDVRQRSAKEALVLLEPELPATLRAPDLAAWRKITQGTAEAFLLNFDRAKTLLDQAEQLAKANAPSLLGEVALRRGTLAFLKDDSVAAKDAYRETLSLSRAGHDPYLEAAALGSLGLIATREERYDESIDWNSQALRLSESLGAQASVARILGNLGWSHFELGDFDGALDLYQQGAALSKQSGLLNDQVYWIVGVATVHYAKHEYATANRDLEQALAVARGIDEKSILTQCLNEITVVNLATGNQESAEKYNREAIQIESAGLDKSSVTATQLLHARILALKGDVERAERLFEALIQDPKTNSRTRWEAEARLAKVLDEENRPDAAESHYRRAIATIGASRSAVKEEEFRLSFLSSGVEFFDDYIDFLVAHHRSDEALNIADLSRSMDLREAFAASPSPSSLYSSLVNPHRQAGKLGATLLFYWLGQDHSYLWVIHSRKSTVLPLPRAAEIEPYVKIYREAILGGRDVLATNAAEGEKLYSALVGPAKDLLAGDSRIVLFPAESLYGINFETLIKPDPSPHFWIEDVILSTASSIRSLDYEISSQRGPGEPRKNLLLIGNPEPAAADFPRLLQAPAEMKGVAAHFPDEHREVLEGSQATAVAYLGSHPEKFEYLHFVTHGIASHMHPLDSAVILSRDGDSYKLYARDILKHPLHADLVTISACNGAGTRFYAGEGLVGLSWAFLHAGARHVISALWEVSDASSTPQLMDSLYRDLDRGEDPAAALRDAKLAVIRTSGQTVFSKPFYWAPFQLYRGSEKLRGATY